MTAHTPNTIATTSSNRSRSVQRRIDNAADTHKITPTTCNAPYGGENAFPSHALTPPRLSNWPGLCSPRITHGPAAPLSDTTYVAYAGRMIHVARISSVTY